VLALEAECAGALLPTLAALSAHRKAHTGTPQRGFRNGYNRCENHLPQRWQHYRLIARFLAGSPNLVPLFRGIGSIPKVVRFCCFFMRCIVNWRQSRGYLAVVLVMLGPAAVASDVAKVSWHTDVQTAWKATQKQGRPLLVFVTRADCYYCSQMKDRTYANLAVAGAINQSFVPLVLDGGGQTALLKELNVTSYPSTFVISPQAVIVARIDGYVAPDVFATRLLSLRSPVPVASVSKDR
jgi:thioredoxin-related protein